MPQARQIELVAEFHAYRIRPTRIAYRLGIDIALIDALLAGDLEPRLFKALVNHFRKRRHQQRVSDASLLNGSLAYELKQRADTDLANEVDI